MSALGRRPGPRRALALIRAVEGSRRRENGDEESVTVALSRGLVAIIDAEDAPLITGMTWYARPRSGRDETSFYAVSQSGGRQIYMHRLIMKAPAGLVVDHVDGNGLYNRRRNLRLCLQAENVRNRQTKSKSGLRGVQQTRAGWRARISGPAGTVHIGTFDCPIAAARAYDQAALQCHGEFAILNFGDQTQNG